MKRKGFLLFLHVICFVFVGVSQTLIMNEVSNGPSGNQEYVEFVVVDTAVSYNCAGTTPPCIDIRGWIFDDNSGYHGTSGIASGAVRFSFDPLWSCVPLGTIIVIYNNADPNTSLPANDLSLSDGNCQIIAPINSALFESNSTTPGAIACSYPATGWTTGGNWNNTLFANGGDCARIVNLAGCEVFSVCWATDNQNNLIYFSSGGSGADNVWFFNGGNPNNVANWTEGCADPTTCGTNQQTPGLPNNAANAAYIAQFNNGCAPITPLVVNVNPVVNTGCGCTGSASVAASGSIGGYTYQWIPAPGSGQGTANAGNMCAGTYSCVVSSSIGCSDTVVVTISSVSGMAANIIGTNEACFGGATATATVSVTGGSGALSYFWSPAPGSGQGTTTVGGLSAQTYSVTVTDALGCSANAAFTPTQPPAISTTVTPVPVSCNGGNNGSASVVVAGGTGSFSYTWSPSGGSTSTASGLVSGSYSVTVTDAQACSVSATVSVVQPSAIVLNTTTTPALCNGGNTGTAGINASGGMAGYSYSWAPSGGSAANASSLFAGIYTVTVSDLNGCSTTTTVVVSEPAAVSLSFSSASATCAQNNGSAMVSVSGGAGGYTYSWSAPGGTANTLGSLFSGNYTVTVTDANACLATGTVTVLSAGLPQVSINAVSNVSCFGFSDGSIGTTASGGTGPLLITWLPTGGSGNNATGLAANSYTITVTDSLGCSVSADTVITEPAPLTVSSVIVNPLCFGDSTGTVSLNVSGGTGAYSYQWLPGGVTGASLTNVPAGNYSVTVSDVNSCTVTSIASVTQPGNFYIVSGTFSSSCNGVCDGQAVVIPNGGTTPYQCLWSTGSTSLGLNGLCAGSYTVAVTDANGCYADSVVTVTEPSAFQVVTSSAAAYCGLQNGSASVAVTGGTPPYSFAWSGSAIINDTITAVGAGSYSVSITDVAGCVTNTVVSIADSSGASVSMNQQINVSCNGANDGSISVSATGGNLPYNFLWSNGQITPSINNLSAGTYCLTLTDGNGCTDTVCATITQPQPLIASTQSYTICAGQPATIGASASGGNGAPYSFDWNSGTFTTQTISVSPATSTTYSVFATDANGCISSAVISTVTVLPALTLVANGDTVCSGSSGTIVALASGGNGNYTYTLNPGGTQNTNGIFSVPVNSVQQFTVTVSDACTQNPASSTAVLDVYPVPTLNPVSPQYASCPEFCSYVTDSLLSSSSQILSWQWSLSNGSVEIGDTAYFCLMESGVYDLTCTVSTINGCHVSSFYNSYLTVYPQPEASFSYSPETVTTLEPVVQLTNTSLNASSYLWNFGDSTGSTSENPVHTYLSEGTYIVSLLASNQYGCLDSVTQVIAVIPEFTFYAPNTFTPDGNDYNQVFLPLGLGWDTTSYNLWIFDRWGQQIFHTIDYKQGWDGKANGGTEIAQMDVYIWKAEVRDIFGKKRKYLGKITLLR